MGFTTQCFIHKNTANIRNRLKELGYYCNPYLGWHNLFTCVFGVNSVYSLDDYETNGLKEIDGLIDCGTNEDLFLALAALRDDTDKFQWFISPEGIWAYNKNNDSISVSPKWRKATVDELIEHFKTKEE
jgi:hypothetical protein